jgi:signal transduction histidine kinase
MLSLRSLTVVFLLAFCSAAVLTGYATLTAQKAALDNLVDGRIQELSASLLTKLPLGDAEALLDHIDAYSRRRDSGDIGYELFDAQGRRLGGNVVVRRPLPLGFSAIGPDDHIAGLPAGRALVRDAGGGLRLIVIGETEPIDGYAAIRAGTYVLGFGSMLVIVIAGMTLFGMIVRRRIAELRSTAEAIIDGDLRRRVPVDPNGGAFADQANTLNRMLDRIESLMEGLRGVSNDIAHDMRMPLAKLRSRLALAATRTQSPDIDAALAECDALLAMFAAALRITEVEGGDRRSSFALMRLDELVQDVCESMEEAAADSGHRLILEPVGPVEGYGDRQLLSQALINLINNALVHTPDGTTIRVALRSGDDVVQLSVADDGPGIDEGDRPLALRRFGRLDASRHRPGHGLGLPLADAVARFHGGRLILGDAAPGLDATMQWPADLPRVA